jgi:hypothetical protein
VPSPGEAASGGLYKALALAMEPQRPTDEEGYLIGLGWRVEQSSGTRFKSGSGDGFESIMYLNGEAGVALVVLSNAYMDAPYDVDTTSRVLMEQLLALYPPWGQPGGPTGAERQLLDRKVALRG